MNEVQKELCRDVAQVVRELEWVAQQSYPELNEERGGDLPAFTMETVRYKCGAPGCLAGWVVARAYARGMTDQDPKAWVCGDRSLADEAAELIGIGPMKMKQLFFPCAEFDEQGQWEGFDCNAVGPEDPCFISPEHAADCIENLAETGDVDWEGTKPTEEMA